MFGTKSFFGLLFISGIVTIPSLFSCSGEAYNISVNTIVADSKTRQPVPGAYFDITCTYQDNIDRSVAEEQHTQSDVTGNVSVSFDKGYLLNCKVTCPGYLNYKKELNAKKRFPDTLFLIKEPEKTDLQLSVLNGYNLDEKTPFIRIKKTDTGLLKHKKQPVDIWGYDFINNRATTDLDSADVWLDPKSTLSCLIFNTNKKGGIYPVFKHELSQSFFLEIEYVPEFKYFNSYKTTGDEKGYFIKCRDGKRIVKMVPDNYLCVVEYKQGKDRITETGIRLNYIIQKDTVNPDKFPLVVVYELLNKAQATSLNSSEKGLPEPDPKSLR